jgi:hypothetical protein
MFADMTRFPNLAELWIWNTNQAGELWVRSSRLDSDVSILIQGNRYTTLNLQGALLDPTRRGEVHAESNQLSGVSVAGCVQLTELWLGGNPLSAAEEDAILATLDGLGRARLSPTDTTVLRVDLSGNAAPTAAGRAHAVSLAAKGWTVVTAGWTEAPP